MESVVFGWFMFYLILCLVVVWIIYKSVYREKEKPLRKSAARHVEIAPGDNLATTDFFYNLTWKPSQSINIPAEIEKTLHQIEEISPLVADLSSKISDPGINPQEISRLIATDQGLTSYILKRVNSPYYGLVQKIDNIFNAIVILGYNEIHRIVMEERMSQTGIKPSKQEWVHANLTSNIAAHISTTYRTGIPGGTMVTLGMLHDIARTILNQVSPVALTEFPADPRERLHKEIEVFGIDHASLGAEIARRWRMPEKMCQCIARHHWPMFWSLREVGGQNKDIIRELAILSIADVTAHNFTGDITEPFVGPDYYNYLKIPTDAEKIFTPKLRQDLDRIRTVLEEDQ